MMLTKWLNDFSSAAEPLNKTLLALHYCAFLNKDECCGQLVYAATKASPDALLPSCIPVKLYSF